MQLLTTWIRKHPSPRSRLLYISGGSNQPRAHFDMQSPHCAPTLGDLLYDEGCELYYFDLAGYSYNLQPGDARVGQYAPHYKNIQHCLNLCHEYNIDTIVSWSYGNHVLFEAAFDIPRSVQRIFMLGLHERNAVKSRLTYVDNWDKWTINSTSYRAAFEETGVAQVSEGLLDEVIVRWGAAPQVCFPTYPMFTGGGEAIRRLRTSWIDRFNHLAYNREWRGWSGKAFAQLDYLQKDNRFCWWKDAPHFVLITPHRYEIARTIASCL